MLFKRCGEIEKGGRKEGVKISEPKKGEGSR
jgi:hypothetical protein